MAFKFKVQEAVREKIAVKVAIMGPSGSGKSYSALRLATGMIEQMKKDGILGDTNGKILFANTEGPRGRYYASEFRYDIVDLEPPYNPELFIDLIQYAVDEKYSVLIIDSSSAEWEGKGGCLELQQNAGGKYQDWKTVTPRHQKFVDSIEHSPIHVICTLRGADKYEVDKDDRGRVSVKKLGVGAKQREGMEYSFTTTFMLDRDSHMAKCEKDNTHIFENEGSTILDESFGARIIQWANSAEAENTLAEKFKEDTNATGAGSSANELTDTLDSIESCYKALLEANVERPAIASAIQKYHVVNGKPSANFHTITSVDVAKNVLAELESLGK